MQVRHFDPGLTVCVYCSFSSALYCGIFFHFCPSMLTVVINTFRKTVPLPGKGSERNHSV